MSTATLQVPMPKSLKTQASVVAKEYGFSSLQELVRVVLNQFASKQIVLKIEQPIYLSKSASRRYGVMDADFKSGKDVYSARDVSDLMKQLTS